MLKEFDVFTFGRDFAVVNTESSCPMADGISRRSQTWARMPGSWLIVSAHVFDQH